MAYVFHFIRFRERHDIQAYHCRGMSRVKHLSATLGISLPQGKETLAMVHVYMLVFPKPRPDIFLGREGGFSWRF